MLLGDEMSFDLNFLVHSVAKRIRDSQTRGIVEMIPEMASILVSYDPDEPEASVTEKLPASTVID